PRSPSLAEGAPALVGRERLGELVELALQYAVELVRRELDAMVGDAVLGEIVRADLLRALPGPDLRTTSRVELGLLLLPLELIEARAQHAQRLLAVLQLALLVLHRDNEAGRKVRDAHRRVR